MVCVCCLDLNFVGVSFRWNILGRLIWVVVYEFGVGVGYWRVEGLV